MRENPRFTDDYETAKLKAGMEKPYWSQPAVVVGSYFGNVPSPLPKKEILEKNLFELIDFINAQQNNNNFQEIKRDALGDALRDAVKEKPEKFTHDIEAFLRIEGANRYYYIYRLFRAFNESWLSSSKKLDWGKILDFCLDYLGKDQSQFLQHIIFIQGQDAVDGKYI